ncbi:hypothetical protein J437_LFUL007683 [Ladona fulva]|uniref:JmjC domain-containing protein n=1 Tax=Ladona fulva TaxID=123851 RepID=A0A8K0NW10_LADFU|nr:hypothetical protein J437_LFUL007683 [Ladona fulva]
MNDEDLMSGKEAVSIAPLQLQALAVRSIQFPIVLKGFIKKWGPMRWTSQDWAEKFGDRKLPFRVGRIDKSKQFGEPIWERNCETEFMTLEEFLNWDAKEDCRTRNKWMYFDYKYMHEWFEFDRDILKEFDWGCLGFTGRDGKESTLWIGSHGAHTPCHADTYGFNLVAQLIGRKRWLLFPPDSNEILKRASRIPYEESSVYVRGSVKGGFSGARGVVLCPGEVLLVPRHWWHRVDVEGGVAISVNSWIQLEQDKESRVEESLVRFLFALSSQHLTSEEQMVLLNPNEDTLTNTPLSDCLQLVEQSLSLCSSLQPTENCLVSSIKISEGAEDHTPPKKRMKTDEDASIKPSVKVVPLVGESWPSWDLGPSSSNVKDSGLGDETGTLHKILNAFCHPEVISLVRQKMMQDISHDSHFSRTNL